MRVIAQVTLESIHRAVDETPSYSGRAPRGHVPRRGRARCFAIRCPTALIARARSATRVSRAATCGSGRCWRTAEARSRTSASTACDVRGSPSSMPVIASRSAPRLVQTARQTARWINPAAGRDRSQEIPAPGRRRVAGFDSQLRRSQRVGCLHRDEALFRRRHVRYGARHLAPSVVLQPAFLNVRCVLSLLFFVAHMTAHEKDQVGTNRALLRRNAGGLFPHGDGRQLRFTCACRQRILKGPSAG